MKGHPMTPKKKEAPRKRETALAFISAQLHILIHELSERECWRTKGGSKNCNDQNPKAGGGWEAFACSPCRARRYLKEKKRG